MLSIYLIRKQGGVDVSAFLAMLYAFSGLCSILIDVYGVYDIDGVCAQQPISPMATLTYCTLLTLSIIPFRYIRTNANTQLNIQKEWLIDILSWVLILTFFITLFNQLTNLDTTLHSDLRDVRDDVYQAQDKKNVTTFQWLLALPENLFSQFSPIAILLYFVNIIKSRRSTIFNALILLSSLTPVIRAVLIAGRTQPIYWFLSFITIYLFFRPMMDKPMRRKALLPITIIGSIVALFIIAVTVARFMTVNVVDDTGTLDSILAYSGQSFINFNDFFVNYKARMIHFDRIFPLTNYFIWHPGWELLDYREMIWADSGMNIGVFFTFLGDLLIDLGHTGMFIYVLLFWGLSTYVCKTAYDDNTIPLSRILIILMLLLIPLQGIFYYSFYKVNIGFYIVGTIGLSLIFKYKIKRN